MATRELRQTVLDTFAVFKFSIIRVLKKVSFLGDGFADHPC